MKSYTLIIAVFCASFCFCGCGGGYGEFGPPLSPVPAAYIMFEGDSVVEVAGLDTLELLSGVQLSGVPTDLAVAGDMPYVFAVSSSGPEISVIDTCRILPATTFRGAQFGAKFYPAPGERMIYNLASGGRALTCIDTQTLSVVSLVTLSSAAEGAFLLPSNNLAFLKLSRKTKFDVASTSSNRVIATIEADFSENLCAADEDAGYFFAVSAIRPYIDVVSLSRLGIINRFNIAGIASASAAFEHENRNALAVAVPDARLVNVFDTSTLARIADIPITFPPRGLSNCPEKEILLVIGAAGEIAFIKPLKSSKVLSLLDAGGPTAAIQFSNSGGYAAVIGSDGVAAFLDMSRMSKIAELKGLPVPPNRDCAAVDKARNLLLIAGDGEFAAVDLNSFKIITRFALRGKPKKIVVVSQ
jgi:hypothetical protein